MWFAHVVTVTWCATHSHRQLSAACLLCSYYGSNLWDHCLEIMLLNLCICMKISQHMGIFLLCLVLQNSTKFQQELSVWHVYEFLSSQGPKFRLPDLKNLVSLGMMCSIERNLVERCSQSLRLYDVKKPVACGVCFLLFLDFIMPSFLPEQL